ncbi:MAG TPA: cupin domain-containing protein, partial [Anaerolineae bacterium]|nr:cupin domain-containing protein [Anaerolineae bacterium]
MPKAICIRRSEAKSLAFGELQIWDYEPGRDLSSSLALVQVKPGAAHGRARSIRCDKYYYALNGLVEFQLGEIEYWLGQGDLLIVPKGEWYDYRNGGNETATLLLM